MDVMKTIFVVIMSAVIAAVAMLVTPLLMTAAGAAGGAIVEMVMGNVLFNILLASGAHPLAIPSLWEVGAVFGFAAAFIPKLFGK